MALCMLPHRPYILAIRIVTVYGRTVIRTFRHKGLHRFFESGNKAGIRPDPALKRQKQLAVLDNAVSILDLPAVWKPHLLHGIGPSGQDLEDHWAIWVSGNWRLSFIFVEGDVYELDYLDHH